MIESFIEYCEPIDVIMIDRFWSYLDTESTQNTINQKSKWKAITTQWYFKYYRDNLYFQDRFWDFFQRSDPKLINYRVRISILYPFLSNAINYTDPEVKIKHDVVLIANNYLSSFKLFKKTKHNALEIIGVILGLFYFGYIAFELFGEWIRFLSKTINSILGG
ncbi:MAG: hypothetical protein PHG99_01215 [Erysipelotrichaceae bacterium]|nr:hypothetical protein [Erysipelotrichaceae bacterium]MDD4642109.1 hypothetical protein [Erysipelotrichaceae bacterium]